ncbi:hypothetical protein CHS0354_034517 [Potamilus streckersoni]|uniref:F-box/LRR-repeat protein 15-like leucin rich repeat domain-containing protein n=1 Tax=Potamilus streckersoni TaxID=2493646 RepID=A0AAE0SF79_9BIVA|nr:hypothetical protein CHS0354_034517 [Potamilus streckersoni]
MQNICDGDAVMEESGRKIDLEECTCSCISFMELPWEDVVFPYIFSCLPIQMLFRLRNVSRQCKEMIREYFRTSTYVNIVRVASRMTSEAFQILTKDRCRILYLNLRNAKDCISDDLMASLFRANNRLQKVDLSNCSTVSNASIHVMSMNCHNLTSLILRECHWLSVSGLNVISMNCRQLENVDLTACWNIDDEAVIVLIMCCKKLRFLSLAKIYGITDHSLEIVARECPCLNHLNVQGCWRISDDSIRLLAEYCKSLSALQIRECRDVTETSLSKLRARDVKIDVRPPISLYRGPRLGPPPKRLNVQI